MYIAIISRVIIPTEREDLFLMKFSLLDGHDINITA